MKKLLVLVALLAIVGYAFAQPPTYTDSNDLVTYEINDNDTFDGDSNDDTVVTTGTINTISIDDIFRLSIVGSAIKLEDSDDDGNIDTTTYYDVGTGMYFGDSIPASPTAGDSTGSDVNGAANLPGSAYTYANMVRLAGPVYNDHLVFLTQNRGLQLTCDVTFSGNIVGIRSAGEDVDYSGGAVDTPFDTTLAPDTWDGNNDGPIHVTVLPWYDAAGSIATSDMGALLNYDQTNGEGVPTEIDDDQPTATVYSQTAGHQGESDGLNVITALDFVSINAIANDYSGSVTWEMSGT
jgi:hypothetical protein